jgi:hypothetical protein
VLDGCIDQLTLGSFEDGSSSCLDYFICQTVVEEAQSVVLTWNWMVNLGEQAQLSGIDIRLAGLS